MKRIGITGQNGFVGYHLLQTIKLCAKEFNLVVFKREYFDQHKALDEFVSSCDVIVHLAALNRHNDPLVIYNTNIDVTLKLIDAFKRTGSKPHVLVSSSTQEAKDTIYGKSKRETRELVATWARAVGASFTGMIIPNVFGPFGKPFYNSVISTFCYQVSQGEEPQIEIDGQLKLIYVGELVDVILESIREERDEQEKIISHTAEATVSQILELLKYYSNTYQVKGEIPEVKNAFERYLFNTYRCYMPNEKFFPRSLTKHEDNRGLFVELIRTNIAGQTSFSTTKPGITRGNHFHTRKIERFSVIKGEACIQLRKIGTEDVMNFYVDGNTPAFVDMPIWHTHNITNVGDEDLITIFWINEPYDSGDPDTWFEKVDLK